MVALITFKKMKTLLTIICLLFAASTQAQHLNQVYKVDQLGKFHINSQDKPVLENKFDDPGVTIELTEFEIKLYWEETETEVVFNSRLNDVFVVENSKSYDFVSTDDPDTTMYFDFNKSTGIAEGYIKSPRNRITYYFKFRF